MTRLTQATAALLHLCVSSTAHALLPPQSGRPVVRTTLAAGFTWGDPDRSGLLAGEKPASFLPKASLVTSSEALFSSLSTSWTDVWNKHGITKKEEGDTTEFLTGLFPLLQQSSNDVVVSFLAPPPKDDEMEATVEFTSESVASPSSSQWKSPALVWSQTSTAVAKQALAMARQVVSTYQDMTYPTPLAVQGDWSAYLDAQDTGIVYYWNAVTHESTWSPPTSTFPAVVVPPSSSLQSSNNKRTLLQRRTRYTAPPLAEQDSWAAYVEDATNRIYYYCHDTAVSQYKAPSCMADVSMQTAIARKRVETWFSEVGLPQSKARRLWEQAWQKHNAAVARFSLLKPQ